MNSTRVFAQKIAGLFLALVASSSSATPTALVQISGVMGFSCSTGNGGFEKHCRGGENIERGGFTLVYDSLTPDADPDGNRGIFAGTIRSFSMTVSQIDRPYLEFALVGGGNMRVSSSPFSDVGIAWEMTLQEANGVYAPGAFTFNLIQSGGLFDLNQMPPISSWSRATAYVGGGPGANETDWLIGQLSAAALPESIPEPASLWLFSIGAGSAFLGWRRSLKKQRA